MQDRRTALVRALGLIERRGFRIIAVSSDVTDGNEAREATVVVDTPGRSLETLCRQLERLVEIVSARPGADAEAGGA